MPEIIRTVCGRCGDIEVPAGDARLDIPVRQGAGTVVRFDCPHCGGNGSQRLSPRATLLLLRSGVVTTVGTPGEHSDAFHRPGDPLPPSHQ